MTMLLQVLSLCISSFQILSLVCIVLPEEKMKVAWNSESFSLWINVFLKYISISVSAHRLYYIAIYIAASSSASLLW